MSGWDMPVVTAGGDDGMFSLSLRLLFHILWPFPSLLALFVCQLFEEARRVCLVCLVSLCL